MKTRSLKFRGSKANAFPRIPHDAPALPEESVAGLVTITVHSLGGVGYHKLSKGKKERDDLSLASSPAPATVVVWCNGSKSTSDCETMYLPSYPLVEESMDDDGNISWRCDWPAEEKLTVPVALAGNKTGTVSLHIGVQPHGQAVQQIGVATLSLPEAGDESQPAEKDDLSLSVEPLKQKAWSPSRFGIGSRKMRAEYSISSSALLRLGLRVDKKMPSSSSAMVIDTPLACVISTPKNGEGSAISPASAEWPDDEVAHPAPLGGDSGIPECAIDSVESAPKSLTSSIETERICNNGSQTGVASVEGSKTSKTAKVAAPSEASGRNNPGDDIAAITLAGKEEQCVAPDGSGSFEEDVSDASGREQISDFSPSISDESRMSCQDESIAVHQVEDSNAVRESVQEQANADKSDQRGFKKTDETQDEEPLFAFIELNETTSDVSRDLTAGSFDAVPTSPRETGRMPNSQTEEQGQQQPQELDALLRNEVNMCGSIVGETLDDVIDGLKDIVSCGLCVEELLHDDDVTCRTDRTSLETFDSTVAKSQSSAPQVTIVDEGCSVGTQVFEVNSGRAKVLLTPARCGNSTVANEAAPETDSEQRKDCDQAVKVPSVGVSVKPESTGISAPTEKIIPREKFVYEDLSSLHSMYSV